MDYSSFATAFNQPKAKIDFIKIGLTNSELGEKGAGAKYVPQGRIELPKKTWENWVSIHDTSISDLQWLLDHFPESPVLAIEIAVDFTLIDGSSDADQLMPLHGWLNHRLFPQRHRTLRKGYRMRYCHQTGKYRRDTLATQGGDTTFRWQDSRQQLRVRLYRKTMDNRQPLEGQHPIRLEAKLERGACQGFDLHRIAELPDFANRMRRELLDYFFIADGIKPKIRRCRANTPTKAQKANAEAEIEKRRVGTAWERYGAQWAAKHGYGCYPEADANLAIGVALKRLREQLLGLKLTRKVAEKPNYEALGFQ